MSGPSRYAPYEKFRRAFPMYEQHIIDEGAEGQFQAAEIGCTVWVDVFLLALAFTFAFVQPVGPISRQHLEDTNTAFFKTTSILADAIRWKV